jgi:hypothetical protein
MDQRDFATACPKLEEVVRLVPDGVGAKLTLAACYEADGRLASAWSTYLLAEATAARTGKSDRRELAHERAGALRSRLAHAIVVVPPAAQALPGLKIALDGVSIAEPRWGESLPVDRGQHVIVASVEGREPWEERVVVDADGATVRVEIGELKEKSPPPARTKAAAPAPAAEGSIRPIAPRRRDGSESSGRWSPLRTSGAVFAGIGIGGLATSTVAGALALAKRDASNRDGHCHDGNLCDAEGMKLREESRLAGNVATVALIAGAISLAGGVTLFATAPRPERRGGVQLAMVGLSRIELRTAW